MRLSAALAVIVLLGECSLSPGQVIVADKYNVTGANTGFGLNAGVNSGINPPATRLTGTLTAGLRYISTANPSKAVTAFGIASNKLRVTPAANPGRFTFSQDGMTPFNFAPTLGIDTATPQNPVVYEIAISMANNSAGIQRCSFALGTAEGDATTWDFGIQLYRSASTATFYTIGKRIDISASGLTADLNAFITNTTLGTYGTELSFLMRVTDAGEETTSYHSRVQLSMDGGLTWFYDTKSDPDLPKGWRLAGANRYILWDIAPDAGNVTYDNFSLVPVPVSAGIISPLSNTPNLGASPILTTAVSNRVPGQLGVTFFGREAPASFPGRDFAMVVLPDAQNYAREAAGNGDAVKEMWFSQTEWIVTNRVSRNIAYVAQLGDAVQNGDTKSGSPNLTEWRNATNAMYRLENPTRTLLAQGIPYGVAVGNHDQQPNGDEDGTTTFYNKYFGESHFSGKSYYGGHYGDNNDNHYDLFSASGLDFIVFYFEFGRYGSAVLNWANAVLATNQNRRVIVVTHYVGGDSTPCNLSPQGSAIYNALKGNTNFFMMLGGHVFNNGGEGSRSNTYQGRTVRTFVSNYQGRLNGGNGLMRIMYFSPSNNVVNIKTYSPWINQYETDADSQMSFAYDMQAATGAVSGGAPFTALGAIVGVAPGALTSCAFPGLESNTAYEWYSKVADAHGNSAFSPVGRFTTGINAAPSVTNQVVAVMGDEPTILRLPASDSNGDFLTVWIKDSPVHGVSADFDPIGGSLTYLPARGYRGSDRFTYQADDGRALSTVATVAMNVMAPPDTNFNNLPDAWESVYGVSDPTLDADGDGQNNLAEYLAGTNPTNAASVFKMLSAAPDADGGLTLTWASVGGTRYRVQYSDGDKDGGFTGSFTDLPRTVENEMDSSPYGVASTQSFTDTFLQTGIPTNGARYYRVQAVP